MQQNACWVKCLIVYLQHHLGCTGQIGILINNYLKTESTSYSMACRYALVVGSDYRDWLELKSYFARSFITSLVQPFFVPCRFVCA